MTVLGGKKRPVPGAMGKKPKPPGRAAEDRTAKKLRGKRQPGSGNQTARPGDIRVDGAVSFLVEEKSTVGKTLQVEMHWLCKITREARDLHHRPMFVMSFDNIPDSFEQDWAAIPVPLMRSLLTAAGWSQPL